MNRFFVSALMIFALVSALVSPACAFVNGSKSFIEICTAAGDIQIIAVDGSQAPVPSQRTHKAQPDCAFCFASSHSKPLGTSDVQVLRAMSPSYIRVSSGVILPLSLALRPYESRGPPTVV